MLECLGPILGWFSRIILSQIAIGTQLWHSRKFLLWNKPAIHTIPFFFSLTHTNSIQNVENKATMFFLSLCSRELLRCTRFHPAFVTWQWGHPRTTCTHVARKPTTLWPRKSCRSQHTHGSHLLITRLHPYQLVLNTLIISLTTSWYRYFFEHWK